MHGGRASSWWAAADGCQVLLSAVALLTLRALEGALTCVQGVVRLEPEAHKAQIAPQVTGEAGSPQSPVQVPGQEPWPLRAAVPRLQVQV